MSVESAETVSVLVDLLGLERLPRPLRSLHTRIAGPASAVAG
jgi:hypothetical protein